MSDMVCCGKDQSVRWFNNQYINHKLKECELVNNYKYKYSRNATEITKFIVTIQGKNMLKNYTL